MFKSLNYFFSVTVLGLTMREMVRCACFISPLLFVVYLSSFVNKVKKMNPGIVSTPSWPS